MPQVIKYDSKLDIRNTEQLAHGIGAKYLEVITSHMPNVYIAKQWRRTLVNTENILIELPSK